MHSPAEAPISHLGCTQDREKLIRNTHHQAPSREYDPCRARPAGWSSVENAADTVHKGHPSPTPLPNGLWCADYKGEFMLGNHKYCYP